MSYKVVCISSRHFTLYPNSYSIHCNKTTLLLNGRKDYEKFFDDPKNMNLSNSLLEVLSIITFEGPITVKSIEKIRGISSREQVRRLKSLDLIEEAGRSEELGHATLYKITNNFLDFFGIENLKEIKDEQTNI